MNIDEVRKQFPQYDDLSDGDLLMGLHRKFYSDMHPRAFLNSIDGAANAHATIRNPDLKAWWRENVQKPMDGETEAAAQDRLAVSGSSVDEGGQLGTAARSGLQGLTLGGGDELVARATSALSGNSYDYELRRERQRLEQGRENNPWTAALSEIGGAVALPIQAAATAAKPGLRALQAAGQGAFLGGIYGGLSGEGGASERAKDAAGSAAVGFGLGGMLQGATDAVGKAVNTLAQRRANAQMAAQAPTRDSLLAQARSLYDRARNSGVKASQQQTAALAGDARRVLTDEGVITSAGRIAESYPKLRDAVNMLDDAATGTMDPAQMQAVRRTLQGAASSADPAERRIGVMLLDKFDDWVEPLAPEFKVANALYRKVKGDDMIQQAIELAGARAGQFSGSGFENALRTEFRALSRNIIKGKIKGLTQSQIDAIKRIADGGTIENLARDIGKAAPRGVVSTGIAGGVPFMIGNSVGGPGVGMAAGVGALAAGEAGRRIATGMQTANSNFASALMRTGGIAPVVGDAAAPVTGLLGAATARGVPYVAEELGPTMRKSTQGLLGR